MAAAAAACPSAEAGPVTESYRPRLPVIPDTTVQLTDFGAVPDGTTLCTGAFEAALEALSAKGGGRLVVPEGTWLTGPIRMRSNTDLHLAKGALVQFSRDYSLYPPYQRDVDGEEKTLTTSPLSGAKLENVAVTGEGTLDGGGDAWRHVKKGKRSPEDWAKLVASGGELSDDRKVWYPNKWAVDNRPKMVEFVECKRLLLQGIKVTNSPNWSIHPLLCTDVSVIDVSVHNFHWAQNSDAIDLDACCGALIERMTIDTGDDGICIKSGKERKDGGNGVPCEHVLVKDCIVHQGHGGFVIGSEMAGGVRDFLVTNCTFKGTDIGLRFKTCATRGGVVEGIRIKGIQMIDIGKEAITFQTDYGSKGGKVTIEEPVGRPLPVFRDFLIEDVVCQGAREAAKIGGFEKAPVCDITLRNVKISCDKGFFIGNAKNVVFDNVQIEPKDGPAVVPGDNVVDCRLDVCGRD